MKLYVTAFAPNPRRVLWTMAEKGLEDIEVITLDILKGEHREHPALMACGASGLPVLALDDGTFLAESIAVCRYLESLAPEPNLFGLNAKETARIEMWTRRVELNIANPVMLASRLSHPALEVLEEPNPAAADYFLKMARKTLSVLDAHLKDRAFIAAGRITMADIVLTSALDFARIIRFKPEAELTEVARWHQAMRERPAAITSKG